MTEELVADLLQQIESLLQQIVLQLKQMGAPLQQSVSLWQQLNKTIVDVLTLQKFLAGELIKRRRD